MLLVFAIAASSSTTALSWAELVNPARATRDILHTMEFLGHKNIKNTLIYTQLVKFKESDEYYSATAKTAEEAEQLVESGFDYICTTPETVMIFRKRK